MAEQAARAHGTQTGDPWIDAYLAFLTTVTEGSADATLTEIEDCARELRHQLLAEPISVPAALFISMDIAHRFPRGAPQRLISQLWLPTMIDE